MESRIHVITLAVADLERALAFYREGLGLDSIDSIESIHSIDEMVATWRAELDGQATVPASLVQDRLLDLWGHLPANETRVEVERWLTETLDRHLYVVSDIDARLDRVLAAS